MASLCAGSPFIVQICVPCLKGGSAVELVISVDFISSLLKGVQENLCKLSRVDCHLCSLVNDPGIILSRDINECISCVIVLET